MQDSRANQDSNPRGPPQSYEKEGGEDMVDLRGSRFLALIELEEHVIVGAVAKIKGVNIDLNKQSETSARKAATVQRSIKANKSRTTYGSDHVTEKKIFKENINATNLQLKELPDKDTISVMGHIKQTTRTNHQHTSKPYKGMQLLRRAPFPSMHTDVTNEPNDVPPKDPIRQNLISFKTKPLDPRPSSPSPQFQNSLMAPEGFMEEDGDTVISATPDLGEC